jgi:hypothetical protein
MREAGFEPTTSASGGQRSIQLSYSRRSNCGNAECELPAGAVANLLMRRCKVPVPTLPNKPTLSCQLDSVHHGREAVSVTQRQIASNGQSSPVPNR